MSLLWELRFLKQNEWTDRRSTRNATIFMLHAVMGSEATREQVVKAAGCKKHRPHSQLLTVKKVH